MLNTLKLYQNKKKLWNKFLTIKQTANVDINNELELLKSYPMFDTKSLKILNKNNILNNLFSSSYVNNISFKTTLVTKLNEKITNSNFKHFCLGNNFMNPASMKVKTINRYRLKILKEKIKPFYIKKKKMKFVTKILRRNTEVINLNHKYFSKRVNIFYKAFNQENTSNTRNISVSKDLKFNFYKLLQNKINLNFVNLKELKLIGKRKRSLFRSLRLASIWNKFLRSKVNNFVSYQKKGNIKKPSRSKKWQKFNRKKLIVQKRFLSQRRAHAIRYQLNKVL